MDEHLDFAMRLGIDLVAASVLAYAIYVRAHCRHEVAASLIALNVGLFAVLTALMAMPETGAKGLAVGFGLRRRRGRYPAASRNPGAHPSGPSGDTRQTALLPRCARPRVRFEPVWS